MPWKADRRLYLSEDGKVAEEGDPAARTLLIGEGGEMPLADARKYGLVPDEPNAEPAPADEKAVATAPANKAVSKAPANKSAAPAPPPAEPNAEVPPVDEPPPAEA
jgi:hypothetical protein